MPIYKKDINYIVPLDLAQSMITRARNSRDALLVALSYITGARPTEIRLLKRKDLWVEGGLFFIKLKTLKLGRGTFFPKDRVLKFDLEANFVKLILDSIEYMPPEQVLIPISLRRVEQILEELSDGKLCPYNFRHSRLTKLARKGATIDELMSWKGAKDTKSVAPYIRGKPIERILEID